MNETSSSTGDEQETIEDYDLPAGGWGSVKAVVTVLAKEHVLGRGMHVLMHQNKPDG